MEGKLIIGFFSAIILIITASFLNSNKISKTQKVILFCLIFLPPLQWILGLIFLNSDKRNLNSENRNENKLEKPVHKEKTNLTIKSEIIKGSKINPSNKKIELLNKSLEMNLISDSEFESKLKKLEEENKKIERDIKNVKELKQKKETLNELYENKIITEEELNLKIQEVNKSYENSYYKITEEVKGWSLMTGDYIEYFVTFKNHTGRILYVSKKDKFSFSTNDTNQYFENFEDCIFNYNKYLEKN
jgi:hypothetical protein